MVDINVLREFLQKKYENPEAFLENVIYPVFGEENYDTSGNYHWLRRHPEDLVAADNAGILDILVLGSIYVEDSQLDIFDVTVASKRHLANNRVGIQQLIRRIISTHSGAFIIFHYQTSERWDWRFTFCHKGASQFDSTDAKRYTFLLGPGQSCRTAAINFGKIGNTVSETGSFTMKDVIKAFDVEALSLEFFGKYKEYYELFVSYMADEANGMRDDFIDSDFDHEGLSDGEIRSREEKPLRDYVKKLLGRIVFLYFIQKKGWLGVEPGKDWGEGDMDFMLHCFEKASDKQKANFLDAILEPLFEDGLNTNRSENGHLFDTGIKALPNGGVLKIPYLNGGLFERDASDEPDSVFPAEYFESLLTFLSQYNFTIDENDPNDAQVGIDPEMLGRIFENLLEDNKDKGTYYTPKEVVQYMCRESLIAYLQKNMDEIDKQLIRDFVLSYNTSPLSSSLKNEIDRRLKSVKVCDPAIGSGAFPMGILKEIFYCRGAIENFEESARIKKEIINNNLYGVDIEKGAVDIARLRFWLAIIVDETNPASLPNLDYKVMQGNSLLESYNGIDLSHLMEDSTYDDGTRQTSIFDDVIEDSREELKAYLDAYFISSDHEEKEDIREDIRTAIQVQLSAQNFAIDLSNIDIAGNDAFFLWHTWFSDVFYSKSDSENGFDIVIGNPPYIKEYTNRKAFDGFRESSPYYLGKMDIWYGFACQSIDHLKPGGVLCFIAQNNWTTSAGARKLRDKVVSDSRIRQMLDFNDFMVFGSSASIQTMIMLFEKDSASNDYTLDYRKLGARANREDMVNMLNHSCDNALFLTPSFNREYYKDEFITFSENDILLSKISNGASYLDDDEIAQGIVPNPDVVNSRNKKVLSDQSIKVGEGVFVVDKERFSTCSSSERKYIKPLYEPFQMSKYYLDEKNEKVILYITKANWENDAPSLLTHLARYREIMERRRENMNGRIDFMHLHWPRDNRFFDSGGKIFAVRKCVGQPIFLYTEAEAYVMMSVNVIISDRWDLRFLTGILNSKLVRFWLKNKGKMQGENYQLDKEPLEKIPLPSPDVSQKEVAAIVNTITEKKRDNPDFDSSELEMHIDQIVYSIYNLSPEERAIIDQAF